MVLTAKCELKQNCNHRSFFLETSMIFKSDNIKMYLYLWLLTFGNEWKVCLKSTSIIGNMTSVIQSFALRKSTCSKTWDYVVERAGMASRVWKLVSTWGWPTVWPSVKCEVEAADCPPKSLRQTCKLLTHVHPLPSRHLERSFPRLLCS